MSCNHITKVLEWGFSESHDFIVSLYGCVLCDITSDVPFKDEEKISIDHTNCDNEPCFGCKAKGLQMNAGDAKHITAMPKRKWESELNAYRAATAQGIQPAGTSRQAVEAAEKASEVIGSAYNSENMPATSMINKSSVGTFKDIGAI